jgi:hypothetical protein
MKFLRHIQAESIVFCKRINLIETHSGGVVVLVPRFDAFRWSNVTTMSSVIHGANAILDSNADWYHRIRQPGELCGCACHDCLLRHRPQISAL